MIRLLVRLGISLLSAALGLVVTMWIVDGFNISGAGFVLTVIIYTASQAILSPFIFKTTAANAQAFLGGAGLISTLVSLILASIFGSLDISGGVGTWVISVLVVWLVSAFASFIVPFVLVKLGVEAARERRAEA